MTRRNIEEGETVVIGTMNNAGTVLLTIADMSIIQAEVDVDETDIPTRAASDSRRRSRSTRCRVRPLPARSPRSATARFRPAPAQQASTQATNFKVVVTLDKEIPEVRPGFTCTAEITTAVRDERRRGADPGDDRARDDRRRQGQRRPAAREREAVAPSERPARRAGRGAEARADAQGARGRVRRPGRQGGLRAGQDRASPARSTSRSCRA